MKPQVCIGGPVITWGREGIQGGGGQLGRCSPGEENSEIHLLKHVFLLIRLLRWWMNHILNYQPIYESEHFSQDRDFCDITLCPVSTSTCLRPQHHVIIVLKLIFISTSMSSSTSSIPIIFVTSCGQVLRQLQLQLRGILISELSRTQYLQFAEL